MTQTQKNNFTVAQVSDKHMKFRFFSALAFSFFFFCNSSFLACSEKQIAKERSNKSDSGSVDNHHSAEKIQDSQKEKPIRENPTEHFTEKISERTIQEKDAQNSEKHSQESIPENPQPDIDRSKPHKILVFNKVRINSRGKINVRKAFSNVDFGTGPFKKVTLIVDLDTTCFPFSKWQSNPPPMGQNWPADCDAFDRNFEFHLDPPKDKTQPPALELIRAITPFGGPLHLEVDITDIANGKPGKHRIKTTITTWSDGKGKVSGSNGGWFVSAHLQVEPGSAPRKVLAVIPLSNHSYRKTTGKHEVEFHIPKGTKRTRLEYRATGHGGDRNVSSIYCIGPGEEFCQRTHKVYIDGKQEKKFMPWRKDCQKQCTLTKYKLGSRTIEVCKENPCGSIRSVRASRANWCPGSITPPYVWSFPSTTTAGKHTFSYEVLHTSKGGMWKISTFLIAYGE